MSQVEYDARFRDALSLLLTAAADPATHLPGEAAAQLRRVVVGWPLVVVWAADGVLDGARVGGRGPAVALDAEACATLLMGLRDGESNQAPPIARTLVSGEGRVGVRLSLTDAPGAMTVLAEGDVTQNPDWALFTTHVLSQRDLLMAYSAVQRARQAATHAQMLAELGDRVERLASDRRRPFAERLADAVEAVDDLAAGLPRIGFASILERLVTWLVGEWLGSGAERSRLRSDSAPDPTVDVGARVLYAVRAADTTTLPPEACAQPDDLARIEVLALLLGGGRGDPEPDPEWRFRAGPTRALMLDWTRMHQAAFELATRPRDLDRADADARWWRVVDRSACALAEQLERWQSPREGNATAVVRWLQLWFCQRLLVDATTTRWRTRRVLETERWRFRADLAYTIRECLRFFLFGQRPEYTLRVGEYYDALANLVEHHALWTMELPREFDIGGHLLDLGQANGDFEPGFAAGHLRHVLHSYVGGYFIGQLRVLDGGEAGPTLASLLAGKLERAGGPAAEREFCQAFALAALFHDVGALMFPGPTLPGAQLVSQDQALTEGVQLVRARVREAGGEVIGRAVDALVAAEDVDLSLEDALQRWVDGQRQAGRPGHALLSAWFLHRTCRRGNGEHFARVVRDAIRATLLHEVVGQTVDPTTDGVGALLILCDEIFEWEPAMWGRWQGPAAGTVVHGDGTLTRAHTIKITDLKVRRADPRTVECTIPRPSAEAPGPRFYVELRGADELPGWAHDALISMSQNLGRVVGQAGFAPQVTLDTPVAGRLRDASLDTLWLLELVAHRARIPPRGALHRWIGDLRSQRRDRDGDDAPRPEHEVFEIDARGVAAFGDDIRVHLEALAQVTLEVLREQERFLPR